MAKRKRRFISLEDVTEKDSMLAWQPVHNYELLCAIIRTNLTMREQDILTRHVLDDEDFVSIASGYHLSTRRMEQIFIEACAKIRAAYEKNKKEKP